jgi:alpha-beta hydrolase superfamily lysophospholipase
LDATQNDLSEYRSNLDSAMQPVTFNGCFGWLHLPKQGLSGRVAVLLCPGLKNDGLTGYRSYRLLAQALAAAGYPTLRFDYPGTGNSCEPQTDALWAEWQQSIHTAALWLRYRSGADRLVLCGFRLGATLAAECVGRRADVAGLVLLAPVLRGRSYIRQLRVEAELQNATTATEGALELQELRLSAATVADIEQADLRRTALPAGMNVLVHAEMPSPVLSHCVGAWRGQGACVIEADFAGLEPLLRPTFMNHAAPIAASRIVAWLQQVLPSQPSAIQPAEEGGRAVLQPPGCIEQPLHFGPGGRLFGMVCRPAQGTQPDRVVVIGNSSGDPHYGHARFGVELARRLAAEGIASLRMDFAGIADSRAEDDAGTHVFEVDRSPDVSAAIDALHALGYRRFAVQGLCSGAYHAYHAGLADARVDTLLLVNLPMFEWCRGDPIEHLVYTTESPAHFLGNLRTREAWVRLWRRLRSERAGLLTRLALQGAWLKSQISIFSGHVAHYLHLPVQPSAEEAAMRRLAPRARTLFLAAEGDAGTQALAKAFGPNRAPTGATLHVLPGLDHTLTAPHMRQTVISHLLAFLHEGTAPLPPVRHSARRGHGQADHAMLGNEARHQAG